MSDKNFLEKYGEIVNVIKSAAELAQKSDNIPLLQSIYDARGELVTLQEEMQILKSENRELKEQFLIQKNVVRNGNVLCLEEESGVNLGPYCLVCYGARGKLIPLIDANKCNYFCNICEKYIRKPENEDH